MRLIIASISFATLGSGVIASKSLASNFKVDPTQSRVEWSGSKATGAIHYGNIAIKEGLIEVKNENILAGLIKVDMNTLSNEDLKESPNLQNSLVKHLKSPDFFKVAEHPESTFVVSSVQKKSANQYLFKGDLTIVGVKKPVEFLAQVKMEKNILKGEATLKLDRTKWGLKYASGKLFAQLGDRLIKDEMILKLKLVALKDQVEKRVASKDKIN